MLCGEWLPTQRHTKYVESKKRHTLSGADRDNNSGREFDLFPGHTSRKGPDLEFRMLTLFRLYHCPLPSFQ